MSERSVRMELKQNAPVVAANGDAVGHLDRVVVDSEKKTVTHIVVQKGGLSKDARVVPISLIAEANADRISLQEGAGDLHGLQAFEDKHYVMSGNAGSGGAVVSQPLAGMPGAGVREPQPNDVKEVEQHIPAGTVALKEPAPG